MVGTGSDTAPVHPPEVRSSLDPRLIGAHVLALCLTAPFAAAYWWFQVVAAMGFDGSDWQDPASLAELAIRAAVPTAVGYAIVLAGALAWIARRRITIRALLAAAGWPALAVYGAIAFHRYVGVGGMAALGVVAAGVSLFGTARLPHASVVPERSSPRFARSFAAVAVASLFAAIPMAVCWRLAGAASAAVLTEEGPTLRGVLVYSVTVLVPTSILLALVLRQTAYTLAGIRATPAAALTAAAAGLVPVQAAWTLLLVTPAEAAAAPAILLAYLAGTAAAALLLQRRQIEHPLDR